MNSMIRSAGSGKRSGQKAESHFTTHGSRRVFFAHLLLRRCPPPERLNGMECRAAGDYLPDSGNGVFIGRFSRHA